VRIRASLIKFVPSISGGRLV